MTCLVNERGVLLMYEAMARRYRPHTFADVIGQEHVAQTLRNSINAQRVAHAYLFCGPHGCGKTSMARIFACALVCEHGPTDTPCGKCSICVDVLKGQDVDVQEIDGASNNGVEQVRSLREQAGYIPNRARFKIYIIDEVHMLSVAAFNALLKTLEEPPAHVKFILATTDPHKVLGTILSRCQRFDFRLVPTLKMSAYLKTLVKSEDAEITDDALAAIAAFSGGSMRDGLVLLDQLVSFSSGKVTREDVERVRGVAGVESVAGLYEAVASHDIVRALEIVDSVSALGTNIGDFLDQLIAFGRDLMLVVATGNEEGVNAYGPARGILLDLSTAITLEQTLLMLDVFSQARIRVRSKALTNSLIPLEMAVSRLAGLTSLNPIADIVNKLSAYAGGIPAPEIGMPEKSCNSASNKQPVKQEKEIAVKENSLAEREISPQKNKIEECVGKVVAESLADNREPWDDSAQTPVAKDIESNADKTDFESSIVTQGQSTDVDEEVEDTLNHSVVENAEEVSSSTELMQKENVAVTDIDLRDLWRRILGVLNTKSKTDAPFLGDVYIDRYESGKIYLSVPGGGTFIFEQLEDTHRRKRIADSAAEVLGVEVEIHLVMRDESPEKYGNGVQAERGGGSASFESPVHKMREAERERGVKIILENFEGSIVNIEDA